MRNEPVVDPAEAPAQVHEEATGATAEDLAVPISRSGAHHDEGTRKGRVLSWAEYRARGRVPVLDGIRAISILLVIFAHPEYHGFWPHFHGNTGVSIFFALSGYLITTLALREEGKYGNVDLVGFYIRRLFRIYPLYFAVLGLYCVLIFVLGQQPDRRATFTGELPWFILGFPEHGSFFGSPETQITPFAGSWSIGIEEKFYLIWPFLGFVALVGAKRKWRLPTAFAMFVLALVANAIGGSWGHAIAPYGLIAIGVCSAILLHDQRTYDRLSVLGTGPWLAGLTALFLVLQFGTSFVMPGQAGYVLFGLVIVPLMIGIITTKSRGIDWLQSKPLVQIGLWSYGMYLLHAFALNFAEKLLPQTSLLNSMIAVAIAIVLACIGCWFVHKFFEDPLHKIGQRIAREHRQSGTGRHRSA